MKKIIIFAIFILLTSIFISNNVYNQKQDYKKVNNNVSQEKDTLTHEQNNEYIGLLEIPAISLKNKLFSINSKENDVNKNVQIIKESVMPDKKGSLILAAHSGVGKTAYFKNLYRLKKNDYFYIYYKNIKYTYKIIDYQKETKDGNIKIKKYKENTIVLTTCSQNPKGYQITFIGILIKLEPFSR